MVCMSYCFFFIPLSLASLFDQYIYRLLRCPQRDVPHIPSSLLCPFVSLLTLPFCPSQPFVPYILYYRLFPAHSSHLSNLHDHFIVVLSTFLCCILCRLLDHICPSTLSSSHCKSVHYVAPLSSTCLLICPGLSLHLTITFTSCSPLFPLSLTLSHPST